MKPCTCIHYFCYALWGRRMTLHWPELSIVTGWYPYPYTTAIGTPSECVTVYPSKFTNCFIYKSKKWLGNVMISVTKQTSYWHSCNGVFSWTNQFSSTNQFERVLWKYISCMHPYELNRMVYAIHRLLSWFPPIKTSLVFLEQCNAIYQPSH